MSAWLSSYVREDLADFAGYSSARTSGPAPDGAEWAWLNANEASAANAADAQGTSRRYPDPQPSALRERLAELWGASPEQVLVVRGSDEGIDVLVRGCTVPGDGAVVTSSPTFGMYGVSARLHGVAVQDLPQQVEPVEGAERAQTGGGLLQRFVVDTDALAQRVLDAGASLVFLATPGNPTGAVVASEDVARLATSLRGRALVVVDEAYGDFTEAPSAVGLLDAHENVVVLRTLSKAHGVAGARIGAVLARPDLVAFLARVQAPYPLAVPAADLALQATAPEAVTHTRERVRTTVAERRRVEQALLDVAEAATAGAEADSAAGAAAPVTALLQGEANFVTVRHPDPAQLLDRLHAAGIVARGLANHPGLSDGVRITIGTPEQNDRVLAVLTGATTTRADHIRQTSAVPPATPQTTQTATSQEMP